MQTLSSEAESTATAPLPTPAITPPTSSLRRTGPRPVTSALVLVGLAAMGLGAGVAQGTRAPVQYETSVAVEVGQVMSFSPWEANLQTARFGQAILRPDLQEIAAEQVGLDRSKILDIAAEQTDDSPIVQIRMTVEDPDGADDALVALVDVTLRDLVESEMAPQRLIVDDLRPQLDTANTELEAIWDAVDEAPGTDLAGAFNQAQFNIESASAELEVASEQWRIDQLPGIISASQDELDRITPVLDGWYDITTRISQLEGQLTPAETRLRQLELGLGVIAGGTHLSAIEVSELPRSSNLIRWAAGGTAIGIAAGLAVLGAMAFLGARRSRR